MTTSKFDKVIVRGHIGMVIRPGSIGSLVMFSDGFLDGRPQSFGNSEIKVIGTWKED